MIHSIIDGKSIKFFSIDSRTVPAGEIYGNGSVLQITSGVGINGNVIFDVSRSLVVGNSSGDTILTLTNSGSGKANLAVEGKVTATHFNNVPLTATGTGDRFLCDDGTYKMVVSTGLIPVTTTILTSTTTLDSSYVAVLCDATVGGFTLYLPDATLNENRSYIVKKVAGVSSNRIILDPYGTQLIEGAATFPVQNVGDCYTVICNGSAWFVI